MKPRCNNIHSDDGNSLYRLCISIWIDEPVRKCGDNEFTIGNTIRGRRYSRVSMRRL